MIKYKLNKLTLLALAIACFGPWPVQAVPVNGLYAATTVVEDQEPATRQAAMPALLRQVVGRLVGEPDPRLLLARWPQLQPALSRPEAYLEQFLYQRVPAGAASGVAAGAPGAAEGSAQSLRLRVEFDERALQQLIQRLGLPQWGRDRPELLTVLAWEGDGRRSVLASAPSSLLAADLLAELEATAQRSGLPIALPLMDLQDQRDLPFVEIRAGFYDRVLDVASRYGADAVLVGRLKLAAGELPLQQRETDVQWSLLQRDAEPQQVARFGTLSEGLEAGLWMATRSLAQRYAVVASDSGAVDLNQAEQPNLKLNVLGINSFAQLKAVEKHLQSRAVVGSMQLVGLNETEGQMLAVFELALKGEATKFEQALRVGRMLLPTVAPLTATEDTTGVQPVTADLWYRLAR